MGISPTKVLLATGGSEEAEISCGPRSVTRAGPKGPTRRVEGDGADRKGGSTKAQDLYGASVRLTRDGLVYGEEFVPLDEIDDTRPASDSLWNPVTSLFEVTVFRRHGPPLVVRNLPLPIADRLRKSVIGALRERRS